MLVAHTWCGNAQAFARCQVAFEPIERPVASRDLEGDQEAAEIEDDKALRLERDKASVIASILQAIEYCMVSSSRAHQSLTTRLVVRPRISRSHPRARVHSGSRAACMGVAL